LSDTDVVIRERGCLGLVAMLLVALSLAGCGDDDDYATSAGSTTPTSSDAAGAGFLAVLQAQRGSLTSAGGGFVLELGGLGPQVMAFSDRPRREAITVRTPAFLEHWASEYRGAPPNAALALIGGAPESDTIALTLDAPELEGDAVRFTATQLGAPTGLLDEFAESVDPSLPRRFDDASLFIDEGGLMQLVAYGSQNIYATGGRE
jgi:hypothetical protein